jgi:hypothetical protein
MRYDAARSRIGPRNPEGLGFLGRHGLAIHRRKRKRRKHRINPPRGRLA